VVIRAGHFFGWGITLFAVLVAPLLAQTESIFSYLQKMNAIYFIPIFSVVLLGLLHRRLRQSPRSSFDRRSFDDRAWYFVPPFSGWAGRINEFHFVGLVFAFSHHSHARVRRAAPTRRTLGANSRTTPSISRLGNTQG
jgi:SSS family solute:Na+ symporter